MSFRPRCVPFLQRRHGMTPAQNRAQADLTAGPKIKEVDDLLQSRRKLRDVVREVHPEVCFRELVGEPMLHRKGSTAGREERRLALTRVFPDLGVIKRGGRALGLPIEDVWDAAVACWSAVRLAKGEARSLPDHIPFDATGLPMAIWV